MANDKLKQTAKKTNQYQDFDYAATEASGQIPLCMIGDSITWAERGDWWRQELLKRLPNLAFIGTHTAMFGYSHAGEGGNNTTLVLNRMKDIPDCLYYNVLIGTNNNCVLDARFINDKAEQTAVDIVKIVHALLKKNFVKKIFLSSILPCDTSNPLRDQCNSATNKILRRKFTEFFPDNKVIWVEYEFPIRKIPDWEEKVFLHPNEKGYELIAGITAKAISQALNIKYGIEPVHPNRSGVRVVNIMEKNSTTVSPVIAGWYTLSCKIGAITGPNSQIVLSSLTGTKNIFTHQVSVTVKPGEQISINFFTGYEGYGYTRDKFKLEVIDCAVSNVLLEKMRPSKQSSIYGKDSFVDTVSPISLGELLEYSSSLPQTKVPVVSMADTNL